MNIIGRKFMDKPFDIAFHDHEKGQPQENKRYI